MDIGSRVIILLFLCNCNFGHGFSYIYSGDDNNGTNLNCSGFNGTRPHIWRLDVARAFYAYSKDPRSTSVNNITASHTNNIYLNQQFNCSYHLPIHWVFHLDPETTGINTELDFSQRKILQGNETEDGSHFPYTTNFQMLYLFNDLETDMLFSCEPVSLAEKCERNFVQVHKGKFERTSTPDASLLGMSEALLKSSVKTNNEGEIGRHCEIKLIVKVEEGNVISYKWETVEPSFDEVEEFTVPTNETSFFENAFRLSDNTNEPPCVQMLKGNRPCTNCKDVGEIRNHTVNGVIFQGSYNNQTRVYKGFFSVPKGKPSERRFYFKGQISRNIIQDEMIQLDLPERIFENEPFNVVCRVSTFLFSYGTIISGERSPELEQGRPKEYFQPYGYRNVKLEMKFESSNELRNVSCFAPLKKSTEWVVKYREVFVEEAIAPIIEGSNHSIEFRTISTGESNVTAECNVTAGNPLSTPTWILPAKLSKNDSDKIEIVNEGSFTQLIFAEWNVNFYGTYLCEAKNRFGRSTKSVTFQEKHIDSESASKLAIIISSTLGACSLVLGGLIAFLAWRIRKQRMEFEIQTQKAIDEFKNGVDPADKMSENDIMDPNFSVMQLPYNESFEVPRAKWTIGEKVLGAGQFGIVKVGEVLLKGERVKVAVKSLKSAVEINEFKSFLFELKIMAYLGQHKNIVSVIASCTEGINDRDIFIGVEYCDNGCLLEYLRKFRPTFRNMVSANGKLTAECMEDSSQYANITGISTYELYRWAYHVACGMDYLRLRKVLHGDLAARNVLLTARKVAKVGDFGLSRVLMNSDNYTKRSQTALPWKWMSPESLKSRVFSVQSDVWAYGIFLYELFTCGQSPYPGISWSPNFINQLENGLRMDKPVYCTNSIYKVMRSCWEHEPHLRPSYTKVKRKLSKGLQRLSTIIRNTQSISSPTKPTTTKRSTLTPAPAAVIDADRTTIHLEDEGIYSNLQRRTMNYYKNTD